MYPKQTHWTVDNTAVITVSTAHGNFLNGNRYETCLVVEFVGGPNAGEREVTDPLCRTPTRDGADTVHAYLNTIIRRAIAAGYSVEDIIDAASDISWSVNTYGKVSVRS